MDLEMRVCRLCQKEKELTSEFFYVHSRGHTGGFDTRCRECCKTDRNTRRTPEENKKNNKKQYFGLTVHEYDEYFKGPVSCGICETTEDLCLDHRKYPFKIRGVLCRKCNSGIGFLKDDKDLVLKGYEWLVKHE